MIPNNPQIDFRDIDDELIEYNKNLYETYSAMDFSCLKKDKTNGNVYHYMKDDIELSEDVIGILSYFGKYDGPKFLEMMDGELVVS